VSLLVAGALIVAVAAATVSTWGVLAAPDALARLHYVGPASLVGGLALVAAVVAEGVPTEVAARAALVVVVLQIATAVTTHATARAGAARGDLDRLRGVDDEIREP
jgi:multisubunit Na+/H+ antiporter MnhG subunit